MSHNIEHFRSLIKKVLEQLDQLELFPIIGYLTLSILLSAAPGILFQLLPITYAWDTHMTLHNLID